MTTLLFSDLLPAEAAPGDTAVDARQRFIHLLHTTVAAGMLTRLLLSGYHGDDAELERVLARPVQIKGAPYLSFVYRYRTRDITKNVAPADVPAHVAALLDQGFRNAHLHTAVQEAQLTISKKGRPSLRIVAAASAPQADDGHNRAKQRAVDLAQPQWVDLGLATPSHTLVPAMARKWKQINRFVEIFGTALQGSARWRDGGEELLRVADFGAGKGYLTFAMSEWLRAQGRAARVTGIELRDDLVMLCNRIARAHALDGLSFEQGDLRSFEPGALDVMVALHACDTATDHAIHLGVRAGASLILCAPCCHKEVRPQIEAAGLPRTLRPLLQHGIHLGQEAEMVTDSLRALLLEAAGYETQVFEFVALEHTAKNKMILAVRRERAPTAPQKADLLAQVTELKGFYGLREQTLERLLASA